MQVQKYVMGPDDQCAMTVLPAATLVAEHIVRVLPYVRRDRDSLLCFFGYLKNTKDLEEKLDELDLGLNGDDVGASTTGILMGLYRHLNSETKEELLLSELQVCVAMLQCMHHVVLTLSPALNSSLWWPCLLSGELRIFLVR